MESNPIPAKTWETPNSQLYSTVGGDSFMLHCT